MSSWVRKKTQKRAAPGRYYSKALREDIEDMFAKKRMKPMDFCYKVCSIPAFYNLYNGKTNPRLVSKAMKDAFRALGIDLEDDKYLPESR